MAKRIVDVLVPVALDQAYSYRVPPELELAPGDLVRVPLGPRECTAVVWADNATPNPRLDNRLKDIAAKLDIPPLKPELRKFIEWVSGYTLSPRGMVLRMALRMGEQLGPERVRVGVRIAGPPPQRMTVARARVLALLADGLARAKGDAAREAGVSAGVLDGLIDEGTLEAVALPAEPAARPPDPGYAVPDFSPAQAEAGAALRDCVSAGGYSVTLLDGVTGSGKTEVYFEAVAQAISRGRQSLILMPEIALTALSLDRFAARFGVPRVLRLCFPSLRGQLSSVNPDEFAATADDLASLRRVKPPLTEPGGFGSLGDLPLIVVEHGQPFPGPFALLEKYWAAGQRRLAALSTKGELILAPKSNHMIHLDQPDLVVNAIQRVHAAARAVE